MGRTPVAEFDAVIKEYRVGWPRRRTIRAVAGVTFRIGQGEVLALLGPNRAGKTTLVKLLLSLCQPTSGQIRRFGQPASDRRTLGRIGYVHENQAFPRHLSARALLEFYGALALVPYEEVKRRAPSLLEQVGLGDRADEPITGFSKGMIQRLGLAQALMSDPELLVMDEPSEGLDLEGRYLVRELIKEFHQRGRSVLLVSHLLTEVEQVCDRVAVLKEGQLAHTGTLKGLLRDPQSGAARSLEQALPAIYEGASA